MNEILLNHLETFCDEVSPVEFYRSIFPKGELEERGKQEQGKYNAIAVELLPRVQGEKQKVIRHIINDDLLLLEELLKSENFIIISPISYIGRSRKSENARYIYAIAIDLDGITKQQQVTDLFHQIEIEYIPKPTYIVFSGNGLHLYYQLENPTPCYSNVIKHLSELKKELTKKIWNKYITSQAENPQIESLFQGFRMVGGITKKGQRTRVFEVGEKVSIDYLYSFIAESNKLKENKTKNKRNTLTLKQAAAKYPEWYEKRVVNKQPRGTWQCKIDLYNWWYNRIQYEAIVGHRYYAIMVLSIYAKKCGVSREQLENDAFNLVEKMDMLTTSEDNHFTKEDVLSALEAYNDNYIRFPIDSIVRLTNIPIEKNKRNYRKQKIHLKIARANKEILREVGELKNDGRPPKDKEVIEWRQQNPNGRKIDCIRETGLSKSTVYKYWDLL